MAERTENTNAVREVVLLSGGLTRPPVEAATGRPLWSMNLTRRQTVLDRWLETLAPLWSDRPLPIKILLSAEPEPEERTFLRCRGVEPVIDTDAYRGPAGALRDALPHLEETDVILAAELSRCVLGDLVEMIARHSQSENDVTIAANTDNSPSGVYAVTASALFEVPTRGYSDIKEQWLPALRNAGRRIGVHRFDDPGSISLRTARDFLDAQKSLEPEISIVATSDSLDRIKPSGRLAPPPTSGAIDPIVVQGSLFPDGSIKAASDVTDASSADSLLLSDDHSAQRRRHRKGA